MDLAVRSVAAAPVNLRSMAPPGAPAAVGGPVDTADLAVSGRAAEAPDTAGHARRAVKIASAVGLALAGVGFLAGCAPGPAAPQAPVSTVSEFYTEADLAVEVLPEGYERVDVVRGTHTEKVGEEERTVDNDYAPFGVYLGDGLFYDLNGNLVLVPQRAFEGPVAPQDAREVRVDPEGWSNTTKAVRDGDVVDVQPDGWGNDTRVTRDGGRVTVDPEGWNNDTVITRRGDRTTIDPEGWSNEIELQRGAGELTVDPEGWGNTTRVRLGQDRVEVDPEGWANETVITRHGNQIRIDPEGWANETTITRSGHEVRVRRSGWGDETVIRQDGDRLVIDPVGWGNETVVEWKR